MRVEDIYDGFVGMSGGNGGFDGEIEGFFNDLLVDLSLGFPSYCCLRQAVSLALSSISPSLGGERFNVRQWWREKFRENEKR